MVDHERDLIETVAQEECAEVIQILSKIRRFGRFSVSPEGKTNREHLVQELGDVLQMIDMLCELPDYQITQEELNEAKMKKLRKVSYFIDNPVNKAD